MTEYAIEKNDFPDKVQVSAPQRPGDPTNGGGKSSTVSDDAKTVTAPALDSQEDPAKK